MRKTNMRSILAGVLVAVLAAMTLSGCEKEERIVGIPSPRGVFHFGPTMIVAYHEFTSILDETSPGHDPDYRIIRIRIKDVGDIQIWEHMDGTFLPTKETTYHIPDLFDKLSVANGDTAFRKGVENYDKLYHQTHLQGAFMEDIIDVSVTAVTDFDKSHPAGSDLSDMAYLSYKTLYPYVQEGYRLNSRSIGNDSHPLVKEYAKEYMEKYYPDANYNVSVLNGGEYELRNHIRVSDIASRPLKMIGVDIMFISMEHKPAQPCKVEVAFTVKLPVGNYPAKTMKQVFDIR